MSGNSTGTVGNAYYKDETGEFTMFGDQQNKLGSVDLTSGSNTIVSSTTPDSSSVKMNMSGLEIEGFSSVDRGVLKILDGTDELSVDANLNDETGSLVINQGDVRVEASGDKINKTGILSASIGGNDLDGVLTTDSSSLSLKSGSLEFAVSGDRNGDAGSLSLI